MTTTIKCRLYPTLEQQHKLEQTLDGCRWVYNYFRKKQLSVEDMQFVRSPHCGLVLDRDHNSSINIEQRGRALLCLPAKANLPQGLREIKPVELQSESLKQEEAIGFGR